MTWRDTAAPIIADVIARHGTEDMKALKKHLSAAYPFGERKYWPYKVWMDEIKVQLGTKKRKKGSCHPAELNTKTLFGDNNGQRT
jgi:hypothetical protein